MNGYFPVSFKQLLISNLHKSLFLQKPVNTFRPSSEFNTEICYLICYANQMTSFYMKCIDDVKWVKLMGYIKTGYIKAADSSRHKCRSSINLNSIPHVSKKQLTRDHCLHLPHCMQSIWAKKHTLNNFLRHSPMPKELLLTVSLRLFVKCLRKGWIELFLL